MTNSPDLDVFCKPRTAAAPPLVLGTMNFGKRCDKATAARIVDRALERGVTFFDTANAYVDGKGEQILGELLRGRRSRALIATKVGLSRIGGEASGLLKRGGKSEGLSRQRIFDACDESLRRLETDVIDVYFLHVPDATTPIEESLEAMTRLIASGKIRSFAASNYASWQMLEMLHWGNSNQAPKPVLTQQMFNLLVRQLDIEYFAFAKKYALHTTAYNPLAGGLLSGKHRGGTPEVGSRFDSNPMYQGRYWSQRLFNEVAAYEDVAKRRGLSLVQLSYAWLAAQPGVDSIIVGPSSPDHVDAAVDAIETPLTQDTLAELAGIYRTFQGTDARYARI